MNSNVPYVYNKNFIPLLEGSVMMFYAQGGVGKSIIAIHTAIKFVESNPDKKAVLWLTEDPEGENRRRLLDLIEAFSDKQASYFNERIHFIDTEPIRFTYMQDGNSVQSKEFKEIKQELKPYGLVVLDPLLQFQGGEENSNTHAGVMMGLLKTWTAEEMKVVLLIHHATFYNGEMNKPKSRGAKEWINGTRGAYSLMRLETPRASATKEEVKNFYEQVKVTLEKDNGLSSEIIRAHGNTSFTLRALPPMK